MGMVEIDTKVAIGPKSQLFTWGTAVVILLSKNEQLLGSYETSDKKLNTQ